MNLQYFGTDGIRGRVDGPLMSASFVRRLGAAVGAWVRGEGLSAEPRVLIGRDTRASGMQLMRWLAEGLATQGVPVLDAGVVPTPAVAHAVRTAGIDLGVVITASHNPAEDNGIKFFAHDGCKLTLGDEGRIEAFLERTSEVRPMPEAELALEPFDAATLYLALVRRILPARALEGWRIVLDTAHGATHVTTAAILAELGAELVRLGDAPDGSNINADCGSEHPESLSARVRACGARLGLAHDGDGDRLVLVDESGAVVHGDALLGLLGLDLLAQDRLPEKTLVVTVMSNLGLDATLGAVGGRVVRTGVGDRQVSEAMRARGFALGGENSGHLILSEHLPTGDGLIAALTVLDIMRRCGKPLGELSRTVTLYPQLRRDLRVREKRPLSDLPGLRQAIESVEHELAGRGRTLVRYSGTESKLRILVEAPDEASCAAAVGRLAAAAQAELGSGE